ncbi:class I SAM-dependent methyltransferase [Tamlana sp. s12]|uniref:class I SAM-dependent methyltransferase n=1 Tax=Tamlana sp. s12 TaxID=1630406 RepID=UPI0008398612|nr:class I SAM-dependent methyltransferase [Tamlana sp. s12]QQY80915.1 class I SAM-dependent methyltransferase [Tamlana sp. s12]
MMNRVRKLKKMILNFEEQLTHHRKKGDDIYAMSILQPLLLGRAYLPMNGGALRPLSLAYILNEIVLNNRRCILEFGSGISTLLIARLIKENKLEAKVFSVEHNEEWALKLASMLKNEGLDGFVNIIHTDLFKVETELGNINWYDLKKIKSETNDFEIDLIIVDGPPANNEKIKYSRYPALFEFGASLADDFCLILDDVNREGEKVLLSKYLNKNNGVHCEIVSESMAVCRNKKNFNPIPIYYSK